VTSTPPSDRHGINSSTGALADSYVLVTYLIAAGVQETLK
jgi:hypothetical protein